MVASASDFVTATAADLSPAAVEPSNSPVDAAPSSQPTNPDPGPKVTPLEPCLTPEEKAQLNWKQIGVLESLASGISISDTARLVRVSRNTIYNWLNHDPVIGAAYNRWKKMCEQSAEARLLSLQDTAIDVIIEQIVTKRDGRLAMSLLRTLRSIKISEPGPTLPALVKQKLESDRLQSRLDSATRLSKLQTYSSLQEDMVEDQ